MRALLFVAAATAVAHAGPVVDVTLPEKDAPTAFSSLVAQYDEPIGLAVLANNPKLGLLKGDVVRAINGEVTLTDPAMGFRGEPTLMYLDVLRGGKVVVVRVLLVRDAVEDHVDRDRYRDHIDMMQKWGDRALRQVTKNGNPSGVMMDLYFPPLASGDIIRKIDGVPVTTPGDASAALAQTVDHAEVAFELERLGKPLVAKLVLDTPATLDPALLSKIKKTGGNTYEIGKDVIDALMQNPMAVAKGARVVPAVKDGKAVGFKLYAIRSSSVFAALGLENGDTLLSVNGNSLTTADKALEVYTKIRDAKKLTVNIERQGATLTLTYTIK
jgi:hypothetical protein